MREINLNCFNSSTTDAINTAGYQLQQVLNFFNKNDKNVTEDQLDQLNSKLETYKSYLSELMSILGDKNDQLGIIEDMIDCKITQIVDAQIKQQNNGTFRDALKENTKKLGADIKQQGRRIVDKLNKFAFGK